MKTMKRTPFPLPLDEIGLGIPRSCLQLPDESIDLIVSSPPYNLGKEYESNRQLTFTSRNRARFLNNAVER